MSLLSRLEQLEAEMERERPRRPVNIVMSSVCWGDDVAAQRAEADAEVRQKNPDWRGSLHDTADGQVCLIERVAIDAENGAPKHPEWLQYLDALHEPDKPGNAEVIVAYEANIQRAA